MHTRHILCHYITKIPQSTRMGTSASAFPVLCLAIIIIPHIFLSTLLNSYCPRIHTLYYHVLLRHRQSIVFAPSKGQSHKRRILTTCSCLVALPNIDHFALDFSEVRSSKDPRSNNYCGTGPFSEPETTALKLKLESIGTSLQAYISLHAYSQKWFYPFAHAKGLEAENKGELVGFGFPCLWL